MKPGSASLRVGGGRRGVGGILRGVAHLSSPAATRAVAVRNNEQDRREQERHHRHRDRRTLPRLPPEIARWNEAWP
jgi:hypothetical protein